MKNNFISNLFDGRSYQMGSPDKERHHDLSEGDEGIDDEPRYDDEKLPELE